MDWFTTACFIGSTATVVYAFVNLARNPHNKASMVAASIVVLWWVSTAAYTAFCGDLFQLLALRRCLASVPGALRGACRLLCLPCWCARAGLGRGSGGGGSALPQFLDQAPSHMPAPAREPPVHGGTRVVTAYGIPAYE